MELKQRELSDWFCFYIKLKPDEAKWLRGGGGGRELWWQKNKETVGGKMWGGEEGGYKDETKEEIRR